MTRRSIIISAGLRSPSSTRNLADQLAAAVGRRFEAAGEPVDADVVEVREHAHAIADALLAGFPLGDLADVIRRVETADALVVVTPTFQGSYSGLFKSFADLLDPEAVRGTPVLLAVTGGSERHSLVVEHALRPLFAYLGAVTVPTGVYAATSDFGGPGATALAARIDRAAGELVALAGQPGTGGGGRAHDPAARTDDPAGRASDVAARIHDTAGRAHDTAAARNGSARTPEVTPFAQLLAQVQGPGPGH